MDKNKKNLIVKVGSVVIDESVDIELLVVISGGDRGKFRLIMVFYFFYFVIVWFFFVFFNYLLEIFDF